MKRLAFMTILCALFTINAQAYEVVETMRDSVLVSNMLEKAQRMGVTADSAMVFFGREYVKRRTPYVAFTLEHNPTEKLVVNISEVDCTTFIEQCVAMTLCVKQNDYTYARFKQNLVMIRYEKGEVIYGRRNHYFTGWAESNRDNGVISFVDQPDNIFSATQTINIDWMTAHLDSYKMLKNDQTQLPLIKEMQQSLTGRTYKYVPKSKAGLNTPQMREAIHNGDIVILLTNKNGLDTQHITMAIWHSDGLHLIHASAKKSNMRVVEDPTSLYNYLKASPTIPGFRVIRINY